MKKSIKKVTVKKASNGYASAAKASGLSGGTKTTPMKHGGKMGKCRGGC